MKTLILIAISALFLNGCGQPPSGPTGGGGSTAPAPTAEAPKVDHKIKEFKLTYYYEVTLDGHPVVLRNLDKMTLFSGTFLTEQISYTVDGVPCTADAILQKPGAPNLYFLIVTHPSAIQIGNPTAMATCDPGLPSNFWLTLTSDFTTSFERSL